MMEAPSTTASHSVLPLVERNDIDKATRAILTATGTKNHSPPSLRLHPLTLGGLKNGR